MPRSKQIAQPSPGKTPKKAELETRKAAFLEELRATCGNVSRALAKAKLNRRTAYYHLGKDREFAAAWNEALEIAKDEVTAEIRRRALGYERTEDGRKPYGKANDRLLMFLLQHVDTRRKWRHRVLEMGRLSIKVIQTEGKKEGLTEQQIANIREALLNKYDRVSLL